MDRIREQLDREAERYGINVVDVRIRRADLPEQNSQAVYQRMQTERQREAAEFRAQGSQRGQEIRSRADRDVTVLLAEANAKGEQIRGEGDANRNRIFAEAFSKDPDFFAFYRSMQAYETGPRPRRYAHGAEAGFGILPLLRRSERKLGGVAAGSSRHNRSDRRPAASVTHSQSIGARGMWDFIVAIGPRAGA